MKNLSRSWTLRSSIEVECSIPIVIVVDTSRKGQQKMLSWRYYDTCKVHCLNLESADIYMLTERRYPLPADVCQAMLDKKLQGDKRGEACYQFYDGVEKDCLSVGFATTKQMVISSPCLTDIKNCIATPEQTATGKEISNRLIADSLLKPIRLSMHLVIAMKH
ncbi:hypothetical protein Tco_1577114 [Tanacetum coccineum]